MILQALTRYYDILAQDTERDIAPPGYSTANVSFALNLSYQGKLVDIFPLVTLEQRGKKTVELPRRMIVPEQVKRSSGILANFLCDSSAYVLGISLKDDLDPNYSARRYEAFRQWNKELLSKVTCPASQAVVAFLEAHDPRGAKQNPIIARHWEALLAGGNLVFMLEGSPGFVHEDERIRQAWETFKAQGKDAYVGQCLVTGETGPIARLHPNLKGVADANPTGATLVGFNARAYESYNRTGGQGLNSPVGERAAFAYTTALNYLLSRENPNRKFPIGDTTVVYWAESPSQDYAKIFSSLFQAGWDDGEPEPAVDKPVRNRQAEQRLAEIGKKVRRGDALDVSALKEGLNPETRFFVLGLAPNAARVAVRFFHQDAFGKILRKIVAHYADLQIVKEFDNQPTWISLYQVLGETYSKKSSDKKASPLLAGAVLRSILEGTPYPAALFYALINRIRADQEDPQRGIRKINYVRAAAIKAFLARKFRNQPQHPIQEVLCMSLNEQSTLPAYLLGRLFAVLEKAQKDAIPNLNATIKDRYFTSACASPSTVFPLLLRLSQHYIAKAEYGFKSDRLIEQILNQLDVSAHPIPAHLSLDEQGVFVLGYYHQRANFFLPKTEVSPQSEK